VAGLSRNFWRTCTRLRSSSGMEVKAKFKELLKALTPFLKGYGYSRRGQNFYTKRNWGVINFQKSQSSTKDKVKFKVNLGVCSQVLAKFYYKWNEGTPPTESACHWRKRVKPGSGEHWWVIDETTLLPSLAKQFREMLTLAVSEIESVQLLPLMAWFRPRMHRLTA
jgi:hypothetical protein